MQALGHVMGIRPQTVNDSLCAVWSAVSVAAENAQAVHANLAKAAAALKGEGRLSCNEQFVSYYCSDV